MGDRCDRARLVVPNDGDTSSGNAYTVARPTWLAGQSTNTNPARPLAAADRQPAHRQRLDRTAFTGCARLATVSAGAVTASVAPVIGQLSGPTGVDSINLVDNWRQCAARAFFLGLAVGMGVVTLYGHSLSSLDRTRPADIERNPGPVEQTTTPLWYFTAATRADSPSGRRAILWPGDGSRQP